MCKGVPGSPSFSLSRDVCCFSEDTVSSSMSVRGNGLICRRFLQNSPLGVDTTYERHAG